MLASCPRRLSKRLVWVRRRFAGRLGRVLRGRARRGDDGCRRRAGVARAVVEIIRRARVLMTIVPRVSPRAALFLALIRFSGVDFHFSHSQKCNTVSPRGASTPTLRPATFPLCGAERERASRPLHSKLQGSRWPRGESRRMPWMTSSWYARDAESRLFATAAASSAEPRRPVPPSATPTADP